MTKVDLSRINSIDKLLPRIGKIAINGDGMAKIETFGSIQRNVFNPGDLENFYSQDDS